MSCYKRIDATNLVTAIATANYDAISKCLFYGSSRPVVAWQRRFSRSEYCPNIQKDNVYPILPGKDLSTVKFGK